MSDGNEALFKPYATFVNLKCSSTAVKVFLFSKMYFLERKIITKSKMCSMVSTIIILHWDLQKDIGIVWRSRRGIIELGLTQFCPVRSFIFLFADVSPNTRMDICNWSSQPVVGPQPGFHTWGTCTNPDEVKKWMDRLVLLNRGLISIYITYPCNNSFTLHQTFFYTHLIFFKSSWNTIYTLVQKIYCQIFLIEHLDAKGWPINITTSISPGKTDISGPGCRNFVLNQSQEHRCWIGVTVRGSVWPISTPISANNFPLLFRAGAVKGVYVVWGNGSR